MDIRLDFLEEGYFYHIYNRGINGCSIFKHDDNKIFFLKKLKEYLCPYAEIYAYCLMFNHYHLLIRIKEFDDKLKLAHSKGLHSQQCIVSKQIGKLMSSYTQAYNKKYERTGALLEKPFKRKRILSEEYMKQAIVYIHKNAPDMENYIFSSYKSILSQSPTYLEREKVLSLFENEDNFKYCHTLKNLYTFD